MLNFFRFLQKHNYIFVFIILEALALWLIISTNDYQRAVSGSVITSIEGRVFNFSSGISNFFKLKSDNHSLQVENAYLRSKLKESYRDDSQTELPADSLMFNDENNFQMFTYIPAQVINNSVNKRNNHIIINKGKHDGVEINMGVVSPTSVVGVVTGVTEHFATVLPVLHSRSKISAKLKNDYEYGIISWNGLDYKKGEMTGVPLHAKINIGDTIVTSGHTQRYPLNIPIGIITDFSHNNGNGFYNIDVSFIEDYRKLNLVYVVENFYKNEIDSLLNINE
ncbi:rod shape-determining protein MreC [Odoribacter sp. OttesenSCG-928-L07]|nr:rod shape-determining protein MreC [Odoribacter sp. OttesenSCG-928-L07]MDL2238695.1 rod shape-determining protein MreC [Bacteroidales bacterium OttesenSCG-928-L14]MDL2241166.1 rod shape-determining protein MreC [Bacteroidales bacterium OttesenSCG-928-K22]